MSDALGRVIGERAADGRRGVDRENAHFQRLGGPRRSDRHGKNRAIIARCRYIVSAPRMMILVSGFDAPDETAQAGVSRIAFTTFAPETFASVGVSSMPRSVKTRRSWSMPS